MLTLAHRLNLLQFVYICTNVSGYIETIQKNATVSVTSIGI
jgi:hypothetical protein